MSCPYYRMIGEHKFIDDDECKYCDAVDLARLYYKALAKHSRIPLDKLTGTVLGLRTEIGVEFG